MEYIGKLISAVSGESTSDLHAITGVAYSGGLITQGWSNLRMVVDVSGMRYSPQVPLLYNHLNDPEMRLGVIEASSDGVVIRITGGIDEQLERGKAIIEAGKNIDWQLSIGAEVLGCEQLPEGETRAINGREFTGPLLHVTESLLREVSVVAVGADAETSLKIAASLNMGDTVNTEVQAIKPKMEVGKMADVHDSGMVSEVQAVEEVKSTGSEMLTLSACELDKLVSDRAKVEVEAALEARAQYVASIENECGADYVDLARDAVKANWSIDQVKSVVSELRKRTVQATSGSGLNVICKKSPELDAKAIEATLCLTAGIRSELMERSYSEQTLEVADHQRGITLRRAFELAAGLEGKSVPPVFGNDTIRAAFSTVSLPGILSNVANKKLMQSFTAQPIVATQLCTEGDLADFKVSERYRLTDVGDLELVSPAGEIKHGGQTEERATNKLETYGKAFVLDRQMIYNDDLGAFLRIPAAMGNRAARKIDQIFHKVLLSNPVMSDGNALFCENHGNYTDGVDGALGLDSLKLARAKFLRQVDADGQPINVAPKYLFVPTTLDALANELVLSPALVGGSDRGPNINVISRYGLTVVSSPYLETSENGSSTGWYLFADPVQCDTFEIAYLQGRRTPTVEQGEVDFNTLGIWFRTYFDLGIGPQDHRGMTYNTGVQAN